MLSYLHAHVAPNNFFCSSQLKNVFETMTSNEQSQSERRDLQVMTGDHDLGHYLGPSS